MNQIPDTTWARIEPLLPRYPQSTKGGRPRASVRTVFEGIAYVLRTGCGWRTVPPGFGSGATLHRYYLEWSRRGVFDALRAAGLNEYVEAN